MLEQIVDRLIKLMGPIATLSKDKREMKDNALRAISTALRETKIYYRNQRAGEPRNAEIEAQIAKYWAAAAIPLRHIDQRLALTCEHKADFWTDPENWTDAKAKRFGIKLDDVSEAYRSLIAPQFLSNRRS